MPDDTVLYKRISPCSFRVSIKGGAAICSCSALFREKVFWGLDQLKGGHVRQACRELEEFARLNSGAPQLAAYRERALGVLLRHSTATTAFYGGYHGRDLKLQDLPVVDKTLIRERVDQFLSSAFRQEELFTMQTSGSTGTPLTCYQDALKKKRVNAEAIYYSAKAGYRVGRKLITLQAVAAGSGKSPFSQWLQNRVALDVAAVDDGHLEELLGRMAGLSRGGAVLLAYASTLQALADFFKRKGLANDCTFKGVISTSELLPDETRAILEETFQCRCYSRYSNQENGIIGQDYEENNLFILNEGHYLVEVLSLEDDAILGDEEIGRIVVTDLHNYAMPMIRYDTGDVGALTWVEQDGVRKRALGQFSGRKIDLVYDTGGRPLSPHQISVTLREFSEIRQFQFVQEGERNYQVKLQVEGSFKGEPALKTRLLDLLGEGAELKVAYVEDIPPLGSGKRNYIINKLAKG